MIAREISETIVAKSGKRYAVAEFGHGARQIRQDEIGWKYYGPYRHRMPEGTKESHVPQLVVQYR